MSSEDKSDESKVKSYKDLKFWQKSRKASLAIVELTKKLPNGRPVWIISNQALRASFLKGQTWQKVSESIKGKSIDNSCK